MGSSTSELQSTLLLGPELSRIEPEVTSTYPCFAGVGSTTPLSECLTRSIMVCQTDHAGHFAYVVVVFVV